MSGDPPVPYTAGFERRYSKVAAHRHGVTARSPVIERRYREPPAWGWRTRKRSRTSSSRSSPLRIRATAQDLAWRRSTESSSRVTARFRSRASRDTGQRLPSIRGVLNDPRKLPRTPGRRLLVVIGVSNSRVLRRAESRESQIYQIVESL